MKSKSKSDTHDVIWLNYFNKVLFEKGLITESERNKMAVLISNKKS